MKTSTRKSQRGGFLGLFSPDAAAATALSNLLPLINSGKTDEALALYRKLLSEAQNVDDKIFINMAQERLESQLPWNFWISAMAEKHLGPHGLNVGDNIVAPITNNPLTSAAASAALLSAITYGLYNYMNAPKSTSRKSSRKTRKSR
jgi:hypothetical protein